MKIDIMEDLFHLNDFVKKSENCYALILGGGFIKHSVL